jgi:hypothetical protein
LLLLAWQGSTINPHHPDDVAAQSCVTFTGKSANPRRAETLQWQNSPRG